MARRGRLAVTGAVEGVVDEAVLGCVAAHVGVDVARVFVAHGKDRLRQSLDGYNSAARHAPWVVLVDLDRDEDCAPPLLRAWLPSPAPYLRLRVAVRAVEAWLMADAERLARFLDVATGDVPGTPETLPDPKRAMVDLARRARRREMRTDMVPRPGSGRLVGPAYASRLIEFVASPRNAWRPAVAARSAASLARCLRSLKDLKRSAS